MDEQKRQLTLAKHLELASAIILLLIIMHLLMNLEGFILKKKEIAYNKQYEELKQTSNISIGDIESLYDNIFTIEGKDLKHREDFKPVEKAIKEKKAIVFLNMPSRKYIEENNLEEIFGIRKIREEKIQKELNLAPGFMLGGFHELEDMSYKSLDLDLLFTTKVYGFGKEDRPIIWRNTYEESEIYLINGPFMETNGSYGIYSALMSEIQENYIYPIINSRLMVYEGFPYISYENQKQLEKLYNRDAMKIQYDILLSDILTISKRRNFIPNGYLTFGFQAKYRGSIPDYHIKQLNSYKDQISTVGGELGIRYSGDLEYDELKYKEIFKDNEVKSVIISERKDLEEALNISDSLNSVLGPFEGEENFKYLDENTVYIPYTIEGIKHNGQEKLEFISSVTAFGGIIQNLPIEDIVLSNENYEKWTETTKEYVKFIDEYRERFDFLEDNNITRTANRVKTLNNNLGKVKVSKDKIEIRLDEFYGDVYYILRTRNEIASIENGSFKEIEEDVYLITIKGKKVDIYINSSKNIKNQ